jgi:hypothetical protein
MYLKDNKASLVNQAIEIANVCLVSQKDRIDQYVRWRNYVYSGSPDMSNPAILNKIGNHMARMSAFLFSPAETRFLVEFPPEENALWKKKTPEISRVLSDEFAAAGCDMIFSDAVFWALAFGGCITKLLWSEDKGLDPHVVLPHQFGVYREDLNGFQRQEALAHVTYLSRHDLWRRVRSMGNEGVDIMRRVATHSVDRTEDDINNIVHQVIINGIAPLRPNSPSTASSTVNTFNGGGSPMIAAEVARDLVRFVELWVKDDQTGDYTTLQYAEPDCLIEGGDRKRNIFIPNQHPFTLVQPNEQRGYFWGRSECCDLWYMQDILATRLDEIKHIWTLRAKPPKALIGFTALTDEARRAFRSPNGLITSDQPNAKVEDLAPELPQDAFEQVNSIIKYFDETSGFPSILMGQGEPGVRAGMHADTLSRTASGPIRSKALRVERQCAEFGELALELLADKEAKQYGNEEDGYLIDQMPEDRKVTVDSHSSSPAFTSDHRALAFSLAKAGAITPEGLLLLTNPPQRDLLMAQLKEKQQAEAKMLQEHPELLQKSRSRRR